MTGCMGGLVAQAILEEGEGRGREVLGALRDAFEPGSLYVELQDHGLPEQPVLNGILVRLARELDLPLVATNDVHYAERADAEAHLYLSCIKTGRSLRGGEGAPPRLERDVPEVARRDGRSSSRRTPRRSRRRSRSPSGAS